MRVDRATTAAITAAALIMGSGCTDSGDAPARTTPATSASEPSKPSTKHATPRSKEEIASAAAVEAVREYYVTLDRVLQDHDTPLKKLEGVATGWLLDAQRDFVEIERKEGRRQVGDAKIINTEVRSVDPDGSQANGTPTVEVEVCFDVSGVDVVNADGKSVVPEDRPDRGWERYTVMNLAKAGAPDSWRVAAGKTLKKAPCAVS